MPPFRFTGTFEPTGDQPGAVDALADGLRAGERFQTLLGATGTGKTFTMAKSSSSVQRPTLVIAHNKTLAAQLCNEFREFFPDNAVEYFVSYYDYYQPEAYLPASDTYIEKDSAINDDIDRLRHSATSSLLDAPRRHHRRLGLLHLRPRLAGRVRGAARPAAGRASEYGREKLLRGLVDIQYSRNDVLLGRARFRARGDVIEVQPAYSETAYRVSLFGDEVESISHFDPLTGEVLGRLDDLIIYPATHYVTSPPTHRARGRGDRARELERARRRLRRRTASCSRRTGCASAREYDLEMMREIGYCNGIENYSRILDGRTPGSAAVHAARLLPGRLPGLHRRVAPAPCRRSAACSRATARARRRWSTTASACRLRSTTGRCASTSSSIACRQVVFVSATPGPFELRNSRKVVEQIIRPTGLVDPEVEVRPTRHQIDDLLARDPRPRAGRRARAGHHAHQEDGRGPDRLPARVGRPRALPALRGRHAGADPDRPRPAPRRVRRARRREPPARGPRPARGVPGRDPRRRQGGLPARSDGADPDDRPRGAQRRTAGC